MPKKPKISETVISSSVAHSLEKPCEIRWWWKCSLSALNGFCLLNNLRIILMFVSYVGTRKIRRMEMAHTILLLSMTSLDERTERVNPRKRAPQSPINILARGKLRGRKPRTDQKISRAQIKTSLFPKINATAARQRASQVQIPPARPSRPSIRLVALVVKIIHIALSIPFAAERS